MRKTGGERERRRHHSLSSSSGSDDEHDRRCPSEERELEVIRLKATRTSRRSTAVAVCEGRRRGGTQRHSRRDPHRPSIWWFWWTLASLSLFHSPPKLSVSTLDIYSQDFNTPSKFLKGILGTMYDNDVADSDWEPWMDEAKKRPQGLRWRDDCSLARQVYEKQRGFTKGVQAFPLLTERPYDACSTSSSRSDPSLEDIELIDVLWRGDIDAEKGGPAEQEERDLQLLTEKSLQVPLNNEEKSYYEQLSKSHYEDFYLTSSSSSKEQIFNTPPQAAYPPFPQEHKRELRTPTDAELDALLEDVAKGDGDLDRLVTYGASETQTPLMHGNVSLGHAIAYSNSNLTDIDYMVRERQHHQSGVFSEQSTSSSQPPSTLLSQNESSVWYVDNRPSRTDITPSFVPRDVMGNMSLPASIFDVRTSSLAQTRPSHSSPLTVGARSPQGFYSGDYSNETSSVASSSSLSSPLHYNSEAENRVPTSRMYGKLMPNPAEEYNAQRRWDSTSSSASTASLVPTGGVVRRTRGRQSKDEKLAADNHLPVTAARITEMSLAELQKITKDPKLTDEQRALIRKIRRRGKNKVAARICRRRRGEKESAMLRAQHMNLQCYDPEEGTHASYSR